MFPSRFIWIVALLTLYVSCFTSASAEPQLSVEPSGSHIALILPLASPLYGGVADAVRQGFNAAVDLENSGRRSPLPIRVYSATEEDGEIIHLFRKAVDNGAFAVVAAITRDGAKLLSAERDIFVPTLVLNSISGVVAHRLYSFGMAIEGEAQQVARLARREGFSRAIVITTRSQLSKRLQFAFEQEWYPAGEIEQEIEFVDDSTELKSLVESYGVDEEGVVVLPADTMVFVATDAKSAREIRPYLPNKMSVYATSQVFSGGDNTLENYDLNGVQFVDMPWLLQADHPAGMTYARANPPFPVVNERFYALGIDAFRLIQVLLGNDVESALPLDGVSGQIRLDGQVFQRVPISARFTDGRVETLNVNMSVFP